MTRSSSTVDATPRGTFRSPSRCHHHRQRRSRSRWRVQKRDLHDHRLGCHDSRLHASINGGRSSTKELAGIRVESASRVHHARRQQAARLQLRHLPGQGARLPRCCATSSKADRTRSSTAATASICGAARASTSRATRSPDIATASTWSSPPSRAVEDNVVEKNLRYGLHFMSSHGSHYRKNRFSRNGAGVAVMYSRACRDDRQRV